MNLKILYFAILFQIAFEICYAVPKRQFFSKKIPINITEDIVEDTPHDGPIQYAPVDVKLNSLKKVEKKGSVASVTSPLMNYNIILNISPETNNNPVENNNPKHFEAPLTRRTQETITKQQVDTTKRSPRTKALPNVKNKRVKEIEEPKVKISNQENTRGISYNQNQNLNNELIMSVENGQPILKHEVHLNVGRSYSITMSYKPRAIFNEILEKRKFTM